MTLKIKLVLCCIFILNAPSFAQALSPEEKIIFDDVIYAKVASGKPAVVKWVSPIRYKIKGEQIDYLIKDAEAIFTQISELTTLEIKKAANDEEANFIIELVKDETTKDLNFGSFKYMGNYVPTINEKSEMEKTENKFVVFGALTKIDQRYYFIRMILKSMGFSKYTYESESSIFFARTNNTLKIGKSDAKIIKVFYTKEIKPGMTKDQVDHLFGLN